MKAEGIPRAQNAEVPEKNVEEQPTEEDMHDEELIRLPEEYLEHLQTSKSLNNPPEMTV